VSRTILSQLVLGQIRESSSEDWILLAIFAEEREDSIQKSRNRFRIATIPKPKRAKNYHLRPKFWYPTDQKKYFEPHLRPPTNFLRVATYSTIKNGILRRKIALFKKRFKLSKFWTRLTRNRDRLLPAELEAKRIGIARSRFCRNRPNTSLNSQV
jgi:hypothetical protein